MNANCAFRTVSRHRTSLGWVRYQSCPCGRFRVLLEWETVKVGRPEPCYRPVVLPITSAGRRGRQPMTSTNRRTSARLDP